jgi:hypothetical protein
MQLPTVPISALMLTLALGRAGKWDRKMFFLEPTSVVSKNSAVIMRWFIGFTSNYCVVNKMAVNLNTSHYWV